MAKVSFGLEDMVDKNHILHEFWGTLYIDGLRLSSLSRMRPCMTHGHYRKTISSYPFLANFEFFYSERHWQLSGNQLVRRAFMLSSATSFRVIMERKTDVFCRIKLKLNE